MCCWVYMAYKFHQYHFLRSTMQGKDNSWIEVASWEPGKLIKRSNELFEKITVMEKLFKCHNGEQTQARKKSSKVAGARY